jgi:uncharacterized protein (TIGR02270 family)
VQTAKSIESVLQQHAEDAAFLWLLRDKAVIDPHYSLADLAHLDSRAVAHLDGLRLAGGSGLRSCSKLLHTADAGSIFAATVLVLEGDDGVRLSEIFEIVAQSSDAERGFVSALGWITAEHADKWISSMLQSNAPFHFRAGLAGLAIRRGDIESEVNRGLQSQNCPSIARSLRAIGETKHRSALPRLRVHLKSDDEPCRFWAAWSAVILGGRSIAESLKTFVNFNTSFANRAIQLAPRVLEPANARQWLRALAQDETTRRFALIGCGVTGDPLYIPTLISQMNVPEHARVAGEAFSMITGVDLAYEDLDTDWPEGFEAGPTEDPADENVDLDPDEDLPWPNQELIQKWWNEHGRAYQPGVRYLCGQPISRENCRRVLIEGFQRQRIAAALELALLNPDEPLFEWRAPGWRQQEWLGLRKPRMRFS